MKFFPLCVAYDVSDVQNPAGSQIFNKYPPLLCFIP